jgi:hypothetical protein
MPDLRVRPAWASRRLSSNVSGVSTIRWLRALHALEDIGAGQTLCLTDQGYAAGNLMALLSRVNGRAVPAYLRSWPSLFKHDRADALLDGHVHSDRR